MTDRSYDFIMLFAETKRMFAPIALIISNNFEMSVFEFLSLQIAKSCIFEIIYYLHFSTPCFSLPAIGCAGINICFAFKYFLERLEILLFNTSNINYNRVIFCKRRNNFKYLKFNFKCSAKIIKSAFLTTSFISVLPESIAPILFAFSQNFTFYQIQ